MLEEVLHNDGLLEDTTDVNDEVSWSCSLDQGCVCGRLKSKQKKDKKFTYSLFSS